MPESLIAGFILFSCFGHQERGLLGQECVTDADCFVCRGLASPPAG